MPKRTARPPNVFIASSQNSPMLSSQVSHPQLSTSGSTRILQRYPRRLPRSFPIPRCPAMATHPHRWHPITMPPHLSAAQRCTAICNQPITSLSRSVNPGSSTRVGIAYARYKSALKRGARALKRCHTLAQAATARGSHARVHHLLRRNTEITNANARGHAEAGKAWNH